jgi:hypothetical protein
MVFDGFKKFFSRNKYQETPNHKIEVLNDELDEFEKEIQEYIHYSEERQEGKPRMAQPEVLSQGGGMTSSSLITPEEEKRIKGEINPET